MEPHPPHRIPGRVRFQWKLTKGSPVDPGTAFERVPSRAVRDATTPRTRGPVGVPLLHPYSAQHLVFRSSNGNTPARLLYRGG